MPVLFFDLCDEREQLGDTLSIEFFPCFELCDAVYLVFFAECFIDATHGEDSVDRSIAGMMVAELGFHVPCDVGGDEIGYAFGCASACGPGKVSVVHGDFYSFAGVGIADDDAHGGFRAGAGGVGFKNLYGPEGGGCRDFLVSQREAGQGQRAYDGGYQVFHERSPYRIGSSIGYRKWMLMAFPDWVYQRVSGRSIHFR